MHVAYLMKALTFFAIPCMLASCGAPSAPPEPPDPVPIRQPASGAASPSEDPSQSKSQCASGQTFHEPGCDQDQPEYATFVAGCYQPCAGADDASCPDDMRCTKTSEDPCICGPGEPCCDGCGSLLWLCLPPDR